MRNEFFIERSARERHEAHLGEASNDRLADQAARLKKSAGHRFWPRTLITLEVEGHLSRTLHKLELHSRRQLALWVAEHGWPRPD